VTDGRFTGVHSVDTEPDDIVFPTGHTIVFRFVNYGWVDGLDFGTRCADGFTMTLRVSGQFASTTVIHLGAGGTNPGSNPFDIDRVYGPPASSLPTTTPSTTTTS
jgi:hypothetical protein